MCVWEQNNYENLLGSDLPKFANIFPSIDFDSFPYTNYVLSSVVINSANWRETLCYLLSLSLSSTSLLSLCVRACLPACSVCARVRARACALCVRACLSLALHRKQKTMMPTEAWPSGDDTRKVTSAPEGERKGKKKTSRDFSPISTRSRWWVLFRDSGWKARKQRSRGVRGDSPWGPWGLGRPLRALPGLSWALPWKNRGLSSCTQKSGNKSESTGRKRCNSSCALYRASQTARRLREDSVLFTLAIPTNIKCKDAAEVEMRPYF